jgi:hypothetical protein
VQTGGMIPVKEREATIGRVSGLRAGGHRNQAPGTRRS